MPDILRPTVLRRLSADDAPLAGDLLAGEPALVWTASELWAESPAWRADPHGHVLAPVDVGLTADGRGVLVRHCISRLAVALDPVTGFSDGEVVTLAVSVLRGSREADELGAVHGRWWVTADGRPVLALFGNSPWRDESCATFSALREGRPPSLAAALRACEVALESPQTLRRDGEKCESALFDASSAQPLTMPAATSSASRRYVRSRVGARERGRDDLRRDELDSEPEADALRTGSLRPRPAARPAATSTAATSLLRQVARHIDSDLSERIHAVLRSFLKRPQVPPDAAPGVRSSGRTRVALFATAAAATVVTAGLLWPADDASRADDPVEVKTTHTELPHTDPVNGASGSAAGQASVEPSVPAQDDDILRAAATLLDALAHCGDSSCRAQLLEDARRPIEHGTVTDPEAARVVELIDNFGAVVVVRVKDSTEQRSDQIAVLVGDQDEWLVRDVFDVADQP